MKTVSKILMVLSLVLMTNTAFAHDNVSKTTLSADEVLSDLMAGNQHFAKSEMNHPHQDHKRMLELSKGQHPVAAVLTCSDSRVPPEIVFDKGLGDLFVIRVAGNVLDNNIIASVEYATEHLGTPLVIVLGHTKCGAVSAAVEHGKDTNHIMQLVKEIEPAINQAKCQKGDEIENVIINNVINVTNELKNSQPLLNSQIKEGKVKIIGAVYDIETGKVEIISK